MVLLDYVSRETNIDAHEDNGDSRIKFCIQCAHCEAFCGEHGLNATTGIVPQHTCWECCIYLRTSRHETILNLELGVD